MYERDRQTDRPHDSIASRGKNKTFEYSIDMYAQCADVDQNSEVLLERRLYCSRTGWHTEQGPLP